MVQLLAMSLCLLGVWSLLSGEELPSASNEGASQDTMATQPCPPGTFRPYNLRPFEKVRCRYRYPSTHGGFVTKLLPPPSGVIVLRPGGRQEQAVACPAGLMEVDGDYGWRFCIDLKKPEPIPLLWAAPLAGIPYDKVLDIYERHLEVLFKLPGIQGYGLKADGLYVRTSQPEAVPTDLEGLPVIVRTVPEGQSRSMPFRPKWAR